MMTRSFPCWKLETILNLASSIRKILLDITASVMIQGTAISVWILIARDLMTRPWPRYETLLSFLLL